MGMDQEFPRWLLVRLSVSMRVTFWVACCTAWAHSSAEPGAWRVDGERSRIVLCGSVEAGSGCALP